MKTKLLGIGIWIIAPCAILAQAPNVIRIKGGAVGEKAVPFYDRYRYEQFRDGKVLYQNGTTAAARLNYNILLGEMQFIDPRGDTLALANEPVVQLVGIESTPPGISDGSARQGVFWYDQAKGYLEILADYGTVKLAVKQGLKTARNEKRGGYEQSTGTSSITQYQFYSSGNTSVNKLDAKGDLLLIKDKTYLIIDQNSRSHFITRASLLKIFGKHREQITAYLTQETVDFKQEGDLKKLLTYCSEL